MPETSQNATIYRGGSYPDFTVELVDAAGAAYDPTGIDLFYRIARQAGNTAAEVSLSRTTDPAITNDEDVVTIPLLTEVTEGLSSGSYYHELFMVDDDGERHVLMTGTLTVEKSQAARYTP